MLLPRIGLLLSAASTACAFDGASPFFLVSSDPLPSNAPLKSCQFAKTFEVEDRLIDTLADCTAQRYTIITQDGVNARDFQGKSGFAKTRQRLSKVSADALVDIPNAGVLGDPSSDRVLERLTRGCESRGRNVVTTDDVRGDNVVLIEIKTLETLSADEKLRKRSIADADEVLNKQVEVVTSARDQKSVVIYLATDKGVSIDDSRTYEMEESLGEASLHTDLRRDLLPRQEDEGPDGQIGLPLFETYQFLTPGLFMGLSVSLLLLSILYVGISAISNLEVSYAAFNKENGPQSQRKQ